MIRLLLELGGGEINEGWADAPRRAITYSHDVEFTLNEAKTEATFTMPDGDVQITATFTEAAAVAHNVIIEQQEHGTVTADKQTAVAGETVTLTITPDEGYEYDSNRINGGDDLGVTISDDPYDGPFTAPRKALSLTLSSDKKTATFTMPDDDVTVAIFFKAKQYKLSKKSGISNGDVTAEPDFGQVSVGKTVTLTVTPAEGYELDELTVAEKESGLVIVFGAPRKAKSVAVTDNEDGTYAFTMPAFDVEVNATFKAVAAKHKVTIVAENGTVEADKEEYAAGETVTLTITPAEGYEFGSYKIEDDDTFNQTKDEGEYDGPFSAPRKAPSITLSEDNKTATFTMPDNDVKVTVFFNQSKYDVKLTFTGNGTAIVDKTTAAAGETVTITVTPTDKYKVESVKVYSVREDENGPGIGDGTVDAGGIGAPRRAATFKEELSVTDNGDNTYSFAMPAADVEVEVQFSQTPTAINSIESSAAVASVKYINVAGQVSEQAHSGLNIVVTTYTDGTTSTVKVVK